MVNYAKLNLHRLYPREAWRIARPATASWERRNCTPESGGWQITNRWAWPWFSGQVLRVAALQHLKGCYTRRLVSFGRGKGARGWVSNFGSYGSGQETGNSS